MDALGRNDPASAVAQLKRLLAVNDRSYELHLFLGDAYAAMRAVRECARRVRRGRPDQPAQRRAGALRRARIPDAGRYRARAAEG